jgi:hypothetical protein
MIKLSIRDRWGKLTEKKALNPEVRDMLLRLDGVYRPRPGDPPHAPAEDRPSEPQSPRED